MICMRRRSRRRSPRASVVTSTPSKRTMPASGCDEPQHRLRRRRLAAARLADERDHLAPSTRERHAGDRVHEPLRGDEQRADQPARDAVADDEVLDLEQRATVVGRAAHVTRLQRAREVAGAHVPVAHGPQLAALRRAARDGAGRSAGANGQPWSSRVETRRRAGDRDDVVPRLEVGRRREEQPRVRVPRLVVERVGRALLDDPPRVHHGGARRRSGPRPAGRA